MVASQVYIAEYVGYITRAALANLLFRLTSLSPLYRGDLVGAPNSILRRRFGRFRDILAHSLVWHPGSVRGQTIKSSLLDMCKSFACCSFTRSDHRKTVRSMRTVSWTTVLCFCTIHRRVILPSNVFFFFHHLDILTCMQLKETTVAEVASAAPYVPKHLQPVHTLLQHAKVGCVCRWMHLLVVQPFRASIVAEGASTTPAPLRVLVPPAERNCSLHMYKSERRPVVALEE